MTNAELREALKKEYELPYEEQMKQHPIVFDLGGEFVDYTEDGRFTVRYPIKPTQRNGHKLLQGGYISAFFDDNYGLFAYVASDKSSMPSINMTVNFHKGVTEETDHITITTNVTSVGKRILSMAGEARNDKGQLVATCQTNMLNADGVRINI